MNKNMTEAQKEHVKRQAEAAVKYIAEVHTDSKITLDHTYDDSIYIQCNESWYSAYAHIMQRYGFIIGYIQPKDGYLIINMYYHTLAGVD